MTDKERRITNTLAMALFFGAALLTLNLSINGGLMTFAKSFVTSDPKTPLAQGNVEGVKTEKLTCSDKPKIALETAVDPHLLQLKKYQDICGTQAADSMMIFISFSSSAQSAKANANSVAATLKDFARIGVHPIVVVEPYIENSAMSYRSYLNGAYDIPMKQFFENLKANDVSDAMMGTWVPFPESNTPSWNNKDTEPRDFALAVNKFLRSARVQFPTVKGSILLNATTYEPTDLQYENGDYINLTAYLQDIDKTLVGSFGIQGFPWVSARNTTRREIFRAQEFLQPEFAISAAQELRTKDIWINTGAFYSRYAQSPEAKVLLTLSERKAILDGITEVVKSIQSYQQNEYRVSVNLFAEDKTTANEAVDWSFFQDEQSEELLKQFISNLHETQAGFSLFDRPAKNPTTPAKL